MKSIRFRQWLGGDTGWHYWGTGPHEDGASWVGPAMGRQEMKESFSCTGLRDNKGRYIYEGDIVTAISKDVPRIEVRGVVQYGEGEWEVETEDHKWPVASVVVLEDFEVVGNAIETPQTAKEGKR